MEIKICDMCLNQNETDLDIIKANKEMFGLHLCNYHYVRLKDMYYNSDNWVYVKTPEMSNYKKELNDKAWYYYESNGNCWKMVSVLDKNILNELEDPEEIFVHKNEKDQEWYDLKRNY